MVGSTENGRWLGRRGLLLSEYLLDQILPFALVLESDLIRYAGPSLRTCLKQSSLLEERLENVMQLVEPLDALSGRPIGWENLLDRPLLFETRSSEKQKTNGLRFAGQILPLQKKFWILELAPLAESLEDLHNYGLTLQDLPMHDPFRQTFVGRMMAKGMQEVLAKVNIDTKTGNQTPADAMDLLAMLPDNGKRD